ncbi:hypothetical protein AY599_03050 [Leptolyngbya valderiana BDU 20041]|nr:hypothetical protein AY599_03050 [Leptolyngbya valderiana BDU 20041]
MREAHAHIHAHSVSKGGWVFDASWCESIDDLFEEVRKRVKLLDDRPGPIMGTGARPEGWSQQRWPTLEEIDAIVPSRAFCCWCFDYHSLFANSKALAAAGIDDRSKDPPGGTIGRDEAWQPNGVLYESAAGAMWEIMVEQTGGMGDVWEGTLDLTSHGFVEIHDLKSQPWLGPELRRTAKHEGLFGDYVLYPLVQDLPEALKTRNDWQSDQIRLGGGKIFVDGTLNSRTAWMLHPFADGRAEHPSGMQLMSDRQIEDAIRLCMSEGLQLAAHAIGDAAVRAVLDATGRARAPRGTVRIEHAEVIDEADVPRFAELGVIASVQPCHLLYDIEALRRACPDRLDRVLPLRELIDSGLKPGRDILFGSDTPIVRPDPQDSILAATNRGRADMPLEDGIAPGQAISQAEAWACFDADA